MFEVKAIRCDCHPETCCCADYEILRHGERVATGSNVHALNEMVTALNDCCDGAEKIGKGWHAPHCVNSALRQDKETFSCPHVGCTREGKHDHEISGPFENR